MGRIAVPEFVRCEVRVEPGDCEVFLQTQLQAPRRDWGQLFCAREEGWRFPRWRHRQQAPVVLNRLQRQLAYGNQAFLLALAAHAYEAFTPVDVLRHQPAQLANAQAAGINGFQNSLITPAGEDRGRPA